MARIRVAHPGSNHLAYHLVAALQRLGHDTDFWTGLFYLPEGRLGRIVRALPAALRGRIERELRRRSNAALDPAQVVMRPLPELVYVAAARAGIRPPRLDRIIAWRERRFDDWVARGVIADRPDIFIGHDGAALQALRAARAAGAVAVLNQAIGHIKTGLKILRTEATLHPEFADTLPVDPLAETVTRSTEEALAADRLLAGSDYVRDTLVAHGVEARRIAVLPYGVDIERFRPAPRQDDGVFRILFVGQISQRKGIKYLLEAFRRLRLPQAELVLVGGIAGSGDGLKPYAGLFRHVRHVPYHEVHLLYQQADVFAYPSLHEGSAFATYEALASGLPVIATPNTGAVMRDGEEGFLVPIRDVEALMERIERLYRDPALRHALGAQARRRAEGYGWDDYRRRLGGIVEGWLTP